jgi:hypothetical protein
VTSIIIELTGKDEANIATHLLQFMFIGSTGFKFPVCYFPTIEVDPTTLYHQFWNAIFDLGELGFKVLLAICDGAQVNRTFIQCHFDGVDAVKENFTTTNIYTGEPLVFMVDPSVSFYIKITLDTTLIFRGNFSSLALKARVYNREKKIISDTWGNPVQ